MKLSIVCTECREKFIMRGDFSWEELECPACGFKGPVIGRIVNGQEEYFHDEWDSSEDVTEALPKVEE